MNGTSPPSYHLFFSFSSYSLHWNAAFLGSPLLELRGLSLLALVGISRPLPTQPFAASLTSLLLKPRGLSLVGTSRPLPRRPCWNLSASPISALLEHCGLSNLALVESRSLSLVGTSRSLPSRPCWNHAASLISPLEPLGLSHLAFVGTSRPLPSHPCWNLAASPTSPLMEPHHRSDVCHLEAGSAPL